MCRRKRDIKHHLPLLKVFRLKTAGRDILKIILLNTKILLNNFRRSAGKVKTYFLS